MRLQYDEFARRDAIILAIGPENAESFRTYWQNNDLPFIGLPDPTHSVLKQYGQEVNLFKLGRQPAQMLIDRHGRLRFVHYGHSMSDIPPNEEMFALLDQLNAEENGNETSISA